MSRLTTSSFRNDWSSPSKSPPSSVRTVPILMPEGAICSTTSSRSSFAASLLCLRKRMNLKPSTHRRVLVSTERSRVKGTCDVDEGSLHALISAAFSQFWYGVVSYPGLRALHTWSPRDTRPARRSARNLLACVRSEKRASCGRNGVEWLWRLGRRASAPRTLL